MTGGLAFMGDSTGAHWDGEQPADREREAALALYSI